MNVPRTMYDGWLGFFTGYDCDDDFNALILRWLSILAPAVLALALVAAFVLGRVV